MPDVQQPEMRRSGHDPLVQDSVKAMAQQRDTTPDEEPKRRVPDEQRSPYAPPTEE